MVNQTSASACVVYTTDAGYLFPTLVSAIQARRSSSLAHTDILVFCLELTSQTMKTVAPIFEQEGIQLLSIDKKTIEGQTAMLARLFLDRFLPAQYDQCLYLDTDIHIKGSLDPLMSMQLEKSQFMAANDPFTFLLSDKGQLSATLRKHLHAIGLDDDQSMNYFNSGVLRISREGWSKVGMRAWELFRKNKHVSRFPDQDVLNIAGADDRLRMSMGWNFPTFLRNARVHHLIKPTIEHFMSNPKPWHGSFPPWSGSSHEPYLALIRQYPALAPYAKSMKFHARAGYHLQQRAKWTLETFTWGYSQRRARILEYEKNCLRTLEHQDQFELLATAG
jgi:lipopolysaccharide biosynthesis glycosyltransferase